MGLFSKMFGRSKSAGGTASGVADVRPDDPLALEVGDDGAVIDADGQIEQRNPPKSKQELIAEIQRNYQEVLELVRKVDSHLDDSSERSKRLFDLAQGVPDGMASIVEVKQQNEVITGAIERVASSLESTQGHAASTVDELRTIATKLDHAGQRGDALAESVGELRGILAEVASSSAHLNGVMETIQKEAASREERLASLIEREQRWMVFALALCGVSVAVAAVIAILIAFN